MNTGPLNGFRALAAFWVALAHCSIWTGAGVQPNPKIAVDLFMILSGFLMIYTMSERSSVEPAQQWSTFLRFYVRRFRRIAPAYYLTLIVVVLCAPSFLGGYDQLNNLIADLFAPLASDYSLSGLLWHFTFLFGLHPIQSSSTMLPDWSLSLEMQFYAVFPLIFHYDEAVRNRPRLHGAMDRQPRVREAVFDGRCQRHYRSLSRTLATHPEATDLSDRGARI